MPTTTKARTSVLGHVRKSARGNHASVVLQRRSFPIPSQMLSSHARDLDPIGIDLDSEGKPIWNTLVYCPITSAFEE